MEGKSRNATVIISLIFQLITSITEKLGHLKDAFFHLLLADAFNIIYFQKRKKVDGGREREREREKDNVKM